MAIVVQSEVIIHIHLAITCNMTLDGFITFLTLLIGGYALIPPVRKMQLRLAARGVVPWSLAAIVGVLYFEFFSLFALPCPASRIGMCGAIELGTGGPVTPQQAAFLVVLAWLLILLWHLSHHRPRDRDLPALNRLSQQLAEERRFAELLDLLQPWLALIEECARRERPFQKRRDRFAPCRAMVQLEHVIAHVDDEIDTVIAKFNERPSQKRLNRFVSHREAVQFEQWLEQSGRATAPPPSFLRRLWSNVKFWFGSWLPSGIGEEESARDILHVLLKQRDVVEHICQSRPRFGARLLGLQAYGVNDFSDHLLEWMMEHPESTLYEEVQATQNLPKVAYEVPEQNALLHALFSDAALAKRLDAYRPVAESALARLNTANDPAYCRSLNLPPDVLWEERGRWRDSTYTAIRFFDIMVRAAASQNVQWHMWLYYMPHFVKRLDKLYADDGEGVDVEAEWPTRGSALLYDIIVTLGEWVRLAAQLDENSVHREPENNRVDHENGNIPKSAAIALGMCVKTIILSDRMSARFKQYILGIALRTVSEMPPGGAMAKLREVSLRSIAEGGVVSGGDEYRQRLVDLYQEIKQPWHHDVDDFEPMIGFGEDAPATL